ncbi:VOC family protein [Celerinatantimonas diazotrophica]|uniref:Glyoxalase-like protein n=1 Tax=Celerinatantimonas diazotrophica TaxID=412034 RepID=A0A4R1JLC1_9GAMM|nr:hypothetical protein [Celerinatantimonas diazotrophica]TCK51826.1 hypothetical protein EV690_1907 [Celerinatantimonas diazotrophica]CAG9296482.1 hypothetical protein CEDIAZO_01633 [Celerinatantimonas diazotrophica]
MFELDHLMIEVDDPQKVASEVSSQLGLPLAWPLMAKDEYTSMGVNFGDINIEFIRFNVRFGIEGQQFNGFSGIAFKTEESIEQAIKRFGEAELSYRVGEVCDAHTTLVVEEERVFPTCFLVQYHFDTRGWCQRQEQDFIACRGGTLHLGHLKSLVINQTSPVNLGHDFPIDYGDKNQIVFASTNASNTVISDLIENLEIVIVPQ